MEKSPRKKFKRNVRKPLDNKDKKEYNTPPQTGWFVREVYSQLNIIK